MWDFWYFVQTLMDNYKPVTISILYLKKKSMIKMQIFFIENMHERLLGFDYMP
jgi:hypothetical protein